MLQKAMLMVLRLGSRRHPSDALSQLIMQCKSLHCSDIDFFVSDTIVPYVCGKMWPQRSTRHAFHTLLYTHYNKHDLNILLFHMCAARCDLNDRRGTRFTPCCTRTTTNMIWMWLWVRAFGFTNVSKLMMPWCHLISYDWWQAWNRIEW